MAAEGTFVSLDTSLPQWKYIEKKVSSESEAMPNSSSILESDTEVLKAVLDCLHESSADNSTLQPLEAEKVRGKSISIQRLPNETVVTSNVVVSKPFASRPSHFGSSSNFHGRPFNSFNKFQAPKQTHGRLPLNDTKGYHISAKMHSSYDPVWGRQFSRTPEGSDELVRGPRATRVHFPSSAEKNDLTPLIQRDQFNRSDFQINHDQAKFFMIKSYSEDDIHKSIKYNVWASTPNGNKKLEAAFREAEKLMIEKGTKCPIFLFFSVNGSRQFVGLAEMIGPVDFEKTMDFWQTDKWGGFFPVKWHIVKDIPNSYFQKITLENNGNKPVTFSRDTQEIGLPQGLKMLQFFKSYPLARSLLDDFDFYERREKSLNESRSHQKYSQREMHSESCMTNLEGVFDRMSVLGEQRPSHHADSSSINIPRRSSYNTNRLNSVAPQFLGRT
ncbi:hypothetical protein HPP92_025347 [Vanilla planifolia]|uniref:YTH domain-containing family protein n=1 Tax=Vanilla planifolia TaxID=51239 RepID=A0A835PHE3_VANPL|nr:hypothetical protein HPP92_025347 [Vanilla planifolia]